MKKLFLQNKIHLEFLRFVIVGFFSTIINYSTFYVLLTFISINYIISSAIGFVIGAFFGYCLNKNWTFNVKKSDNKLIEIVKYYFVYFCSLIASLVFLKIMVDKIAISPVIANLIVIVFTTFANFVGIRFMVFISK